MSKKLIALLLAALLVVGMLAGCASQEQTAEEPSTVEDTQTVEPETAEDPEETAEPEQTEEPDVSEEDLGVIETLYSPNFSIERLGDGIKRVIDGEGRELILVPRELEEVPAEYAGGIVIRTPVQNAVFLSSTQVCAFRTMNDPAIIACIGGVTASADSWSDIPGIQEAMEAGDILYVGGDGMGDPDYELIQSLEPDVVFVYTGNYPQSSQIAKLEELGINYAVDNEYMEGNYMARMEWMRFLMTFFNADDAIDEIMLAAQAAIDEVKSQIEGLEQPKVAVFSAHSGTIYGTSDDSWVGTMLADMGGVNVFSGVTESTLTAEAAFEYIHDADIIIYTSTVSYCNGLAGIEEAFPLITECKAYENGAVYQYTDIFWHGIDQTDIMAGDLAAVIYPDVFADRALSYYVLAE